MTTEDVLQLVGNMLPSKTYPTIEDAISVTRALGYRYLWIDRYCIDQSNPKEVLAQVSRMDSVYNEASLVIIAADGMGPTHGLPDVNGRPRSLLPAVELENILLYYTPPKIFRSLKTSKWNSRGWTFQEGGLHRSPNLF